MTRSQVTANSMALITLLCIAGALWRPEWALLDWAAVGAILLGSVLAIAFQTPADRDQARKTWWLLPSLMTGIAVQLVYLAAPDERLRSALIGTCLVLAGLGLAWVRRRVS